jgi:hypothetical protein
VAEALADAELAYGATIPTGTYLDMRANLPLVDPHKVASPVLLIVCAGPASPIRSSGADQGPKLTARDR